MKNYIILKAGLWVCVYLVVHSSLWGLTFEIPEEFRTESEVESTETANKREPDERQRAPAAPGSTVSLEEGPEEISGGEGPPPSDAGVRGQSGIVGNVVDQETGEPVQGVAAMLEGLAFGTLTDANGAYVIDDVPPGEYTLVFIKSGFIESRVTGVAVSESEFANVDFSLPPRPVEMTDDVYQLQNFTVTAEEASLMMSTIELQRMSGTQLDVMSAEDFSRYAASDISDAVKSITGVSLSGGKYPVIRGLNDRYSVTQVDGATMPSPDPDRPAVPLDIFPTGVFESVETRKTHTPDMPGEASGGLLDLRLLSFPEERILKFSASTGFNTESQDKWLTTRRGGSEDFLGNGSETRDFDSSSNTSKVEVPILPIGSLQERLGAARAEQLAEAQQEFRPESATPDPDFGASFLFGDTFERENGHRVGVLLGVSQKTASRTTDKSVNTVRTSEASGAQSSVGESAYMVNEFNSNRLTGTREGQLSALAGAGYEFAPGKSVQWKTLFTQNGLDEAVIQNGGQQWQDGSQNNDETFDKNNGDASQAPGAASSFESTQYTQRKLLAHQLSGELDLLEDAPGASMEFSFLTADNEQLEPDTYDTRGRDASSRFRRETNQESAVFSLDFTVALDRHLESLERANSMDLKFGYSHENADRDFEQRQKDLSQVTVPPDTPGNLASETRETDSGITGQADGEREIEGVYLMLDAQPSDWLQLIGGVRHETTDLSYEGFGNTPQAGNAGFNPELAEANPIDQSDLIPSLGANVDLPRDVKLRLAYSRTVSRPTFRELQPFPVFNLAYNEIEVGNPGFMRAGSGPFFNPVLKDEFAEFRGLRMAHVHNIDTRAEWYPTEQSMFAIGLFYKDVGNPIERIEVSGQQSEVPVYTFINNNNDADIYGVEIEMQTNVGDFLQSEPLDFITVGGNFTYIDAQVKRSRPETDTAILSDIDPAQISESRRLFDQPDYIANVFVTFEMEPIGGTLSLSANHTGKRLVGALGGSGMDIFEDAVTTLNLSYTQAVPWVDGLSIKFTAKNLTNPTYRRITERGNNEVPLYDEWGNRKDSIALESYKAGISFGISANYTF